MAQVRDARADVQLSGFVDSLVTTVMAGDQSEPWQRVDNAGQVLWSPALTRRWIAAGSGVCDHDDFGLS